MNDAGEALEQKLDRMLGDVTTLRDPGVMAELEKQIAAEGDED